MKDFFAAQGVNPLLDLKLDDWLGVAHVDEVVQLASDGNKVLIADPDLAWALALWATKLDPNVRMHPKMNGNELLPGYTAEGIKASFILANATFRKQNLQYAQASNAPARRVQHGEDGDEADRRGLRARRNGPAPPARSRCCAAARSRTCSAT